MGLRDGGLEWQKTTDLSLAQAQAVERKCDKNPPLWSTLPDQTTAALHDCMDRYAQLLASSLLTSGKIPLPASTPSPSLLLTLPDISASAPDAQQTAVTPLGAHPSATLSAPALPTSLASLSLPAVPPGVTVNPPVPAFLPVRTVPPVPAPSAPAALRQQSCPDSNKIVRRKREHESWTRQTWLLGQPDRPVIKRLQWQLKRAKTDASEAPPRPFGVHVVCMATSSGSGGCGYRMAREPLMDHNGVAGVGEWHMVLQPHFHCPGGQGRFRPAVFETVCDESSCDCPCHAKGSGIDPADCSCKGMWRCATANEWVKTTTPPTVNSWKDRREAFAKSKVERDVAKFLVSSAGAGTALECTLT